MIDSHCHLNDPRFDEDLEEVLKRAGSEGLRRVVIVGYDLSSSRRAVDLVRRTVSRTDFPERSAVVGVSPHEAAAWNGEAETAVRRMSDEPEVVGIGETGLDDHYPEPSRAEQERALIAQLAIAEEKQVPVVFHLRDAWEDFFRILDREGHTTGGVLHCFTGDEKAMRMGVERGLFVSFSGILTFKKSVSLRAVAGQTPLENLLVETDAPYLAPVPYRGKRCEPAQVTATARCLADVRGMEYEELEKVLESNLDRLFPRERSRDR